MFLSLIGLCVGRLVGKQKITRLKLSSSGGKTTGPAGKLQSNNSGSQKVGVLEVIC